MPLLDELHQSFCGREDVNSVLEHTTRLQVYECMCAHVIIDMVYNGLGKLEAVQQKKIESEKLPSGV
jgi:hypothetical protein